MAGRDTALFTTARTSHFGILMSDDEDSDSESPVETTEKTKANNSAVGVVKAVEDSSLASGTNAMATPATDDSDWNCAKAKTHHKKPAGGARNVGFTRGTSGFPNSHTHHHQGGHNNPATRKTIAPVTLEQLNAEQTLEIYNFPEAWRTSDIRKALAVFEGQYRLKWQNDTSCFIHFETAELAAKALTEVQPENASVRPFAPENVILASPKPDTSQMSAENTLEVYSFPSAWHSAELNKLLSAFAGQYKLKWRNDASCYAVFESHETMQKAFAEVSNESACKVRHFVSLGDTVAHPHSHAQQ